MAISSMSEYVLEPFLRLNALLKELLSYRDRKRFRFKVERTNSHSIALISQIIDIKLKHITKLYMTVCQVLGSHPALFLLLLGILVLHAAHTGHTCQTVEAGDALARVLALNSHIW